MKKLGIGLILVGCVGVGCSAPSAESNSDGNVPAVAPGDVSPTGLASIPVGTSGRHLVVFRGESSVPADAAKKIKAAGGTLVQSVGALGIAVATGPSSFDDKIAKDPSVLAAGPERIWKQPKTSAGPRWQIPPPAPPGVDLYYGAQWNIRRINAPAAAASVDYSKVVVAVIDTGVDYWHPELDPDLFNDSDDQVVRKVSTNLSSFANWGPAVFPEAPPSNCDGGGVPPGYPQYPTGFRLDVPDPTCVLMPTPAVEGDFHGTHVAGIIGASGNDNLVRGVAPGIKLAAYKVFDRFVVGPPAGAPPPPPGAFPYSEIGFGAADLSVFLAIMDAADHGDAAINLSLGGLIEDKTTKEANAAIQAWSRVVKYANNRGTVVVAAAGNESANLNGKVFSIPADLPGVLSVGASGTATQFPYPPFEPFTQVSGLPLWFGEQLDAAPGSDVVAFYSNTGGSVDISAPGGDLGPRNDNPMNLIFSSIPGGWAPLAGTSMATPHVAAVAALVRAKHPEFTTGDIKARLKGTAQPMGNHLGFGAGIVDAAAATAN